MGDYQRVATFSISMNEVPHFSIHRDRGRDFLDFMSCCLFKDENRWSWAASNKSENHTHAWHIVCSTISSEELFPDDGRLTTYMPQKENIVYGVNNGQ